VVDARLVVGAGDGCIGAAEVVAGPVTAAEEVVVVGRSDGAAEVVSGPGTAAEEVVVVGRSDVGRCVKVVTSGIELGPPIVVAVTRLWFAAIVVCVAPAAVVNTGVWLAMVVLADWLVVVAAVWFDADDGVVGVQFAASRVMVGVWFVDVVVGVWFAGVVDGGPAVLLPPG